MNQPELTGTIVQQQYQSAWTKPMMRIKMTIEKAEKETGVIYGYLIIE